MNTSSNYSTKSPILFLVFNRPDVTKQVFSAIRNAKPKRLYIAADGPRKNKENEDNLCVETRKIATNIDWNCEIKTLFREENLGCKVAVSSAVDWFFQNEEEGIILEDDCLPNSDFFKFCDVMIEKYRIDYRIRHIGGCNLQFGNKRGEASYYYSNLTHVWGWASWRRAWKDYDVNLTKYKETDTEKGFFTIFNDTILAQEWNTVFKNLIQNKIDTWDYQWAITNFFNNGLSVIPNSNLIVNIGFGNNATHTINIDENISNMKLENLDYITSPEIILPDKEADRFTLFREFEVTKKAKKRNFLLKLFR